MLDPWDGLGQRNGGAAALLLALPGGMSFFVARRTEAGLVTSVLRGVRVLAFLTGAYALAGAAVVVAGNDECGSDGWAWFLSNHGLIGCGSDTLWWLMVGAFATLFPLAFATRNAWNPPLRREFDDDEDDFDTTRHVWLDQPEAREE